MLCKDYFSSVFLSVVSPISGSPAMLVNILNTPANAEADATTSQLTSVSITVVPIVATAVCAIVFAARTPAAFNHFLVIKITPFYPFIKCANP